MRRQRVLAISMSVLVFVFAALSVAGQVATPAVHPAAGSCVAAPVAGTPPASFGISTAEVAGTPAGDELGDEAPLPQRTPPPGTPAAAAVLERIRAAEETLANCFTAGDYLAFTSLLSPKALHDELGVTAPGEPATHTVGYVLLREELLSVSDAQTHDDGRVSAEVLFAFEGERRRARDIFVETEGWLLLDEMIELPLEPAPVGTPTTSLDEATLQGLSILGFAPEYVPSEPWMVAGGTAISMRPGDTRVLVLGVLDFDGCGPIGFLCFIPVAVSAGWSVAPINGASIDPNSGLLTIDAMVPSGSVFTARADVEGGRRHVAADVYVYTPEGNPLVGLWREEAQVACGTRAESDPTLAIEELNFDADGTFAVTWVPFESYVDYWGTYTFDLERGTLELTVTGGNHIPPDVDGEGRFTVDATRRLNLTDIWLGASPQRDPGTPSASSGPANCGHRFAG